MQGLNMSLNDIIANASQIRQQNMMNSGNNQRNQGQGKRARPQRGMNRTVSITMPLNRGVGNRNAGNRGRGNGNGNRMMRQDNTRLIMPGTQVLNQSVKAQRVKQVKMKMNRNKKVIQAKKMLPKVDRNTEIVLDRDTKQQMIILQREPISQPNRRTPTPKQAPRKQSSTINGFSMGWLGQQFLVCFYLVFIYCNVIYVSVEYLHFPLFIKRILMAQKQTVFDLQKYQGKKIRVKFQLGREVIGDLKGFDPLMNIVLDNAVEYLRDPDDLYTLSGESRQVGTVICRGPNILTVNPIEGMVEIQNPYE